MAYSHSLAVSAAGTTLSVGATPTLVGEVEDPGQFGGAWATAEVTNSQSGVDREYIQTVRDNGKLTVQGHFQPTDAGQIIVEAAYEAGGSMPCVIQLPKAGGQSSTGNKYAFNALVLSRKFPTKVTEDLKWSVDLQITGSITITAGS